MQSVAEMHNSFGNITFTTPVCPKQSAQRLQPDLLQKPQPLTLQVQPLPREPESPRYNIQPSVRGFQGMRDGSAFDCLNTLF